MTLQETYATYGLVANAGRVPGVHVQELVDWLDGRVAAGVGICSASPCATSAT